jgi:glycosyltransferase involved in cell wall biosynthesis
MKTSVLVIAHNEEKNIRQCLASVTAQTVVPDEIVVICHNCTDSTEAIARSFTTMKVISYTGPEGVPFARIKGFDTVSGDIVACLDGDSIASPHWLSNIVRPLLQKEVTIVAGYVVLTNTLFARLSSFWQFVILKKILRNRQNCFAWGSNFACRKEDYERVGGIAPLILLKDQLHLNFWAEDFYLSRALMQRGTIQFALDAKTYTTLPEWKINIKTAPVKQWMQDNRRLLEYFDATK